MNRKQRNFIIQIIIVLGILSAIWFSFGRNVLSPVRSPEAPEQLAGMKLGKIIEGPEALAQVSKLHGTDVGLVSAFIAEYSHDFNPYHNNNERVTVWVGKTESSDAARELTARMWKAIEDGGSPFSDPQRLVIFGREVFQVKGPGGEHFFYDSNRADKQVIWISVVAGNALSVLDEALESF